MSLDFRQENEEITRIVHRLLSLPQSYERGHLIPWEQLEEIAGPRDGFRFRYVVKKFRTRLLRERQINTLCAIGTGIRLLTDAEAATEIPQMRWKKTFRQLGRGLREMQAIDPATLSDHGRRLLLAQQEAMQAERRNVFAAKQNLVHRRLPITHSDDPRRAAH